MGNSLSSDDFKCIGGENWYKERCSKNFLVSVTSTLFADIPTIPDVFREKESIRFSRSQNIRLSENVRNIYLDNINNFALKSAAGVLEADDTLGLETAHLQELSVIVNTTSSFEEFFIRRNALIIFMHRILRSAQLHHASLRPSIPGSSSFCTCNRNPHLEFCPLHDIQDEDKKFLFLPLSTNMRVQRGPDWQWADQDGGAGNYGIVLNVREWKNNPNLGVRVKWESNGVENTYRYGGENCYDVILVNPLSHRDYRPFQGVEYPSCISWNQYCSAYLGNGFAKSRGLWPSKITKQQLQSMLPDFDTEAKLDNSIITQSFLVLKEIIDLAIQDSFDFLSEKRNVKIYERNSISQGARMDILFPFQIYLFSQVQDDLLYERSETSILEKYLDYIYANCNELIKKATSCFCRKKISIEEILKCLQNSILHQLVPFIMTCLYCGSLNDDLMIKNDEQISDLVHHWVNFLKVTQYNVDSMEHEDNIIQTDLLSKSYSSRHSNKTPWYFSLLYILVAADSRYIKGLAPAQVPLDSNDELLMVWARSYILSGGLANDISEIPGNLFLYPLYYGIDPMWKVLYSWMDSHFKEPMWKSKMYRNTLLEFRIFIVLIHLSNKHKTIENVYACLKESDPSVVPVPEEIGMMWKAVTIVREHLRTKKQEFQITKDIKGLQRSTSYLNLRNSHRSMATHSESESESEEIKLEPSSYLSNDRLSVQSLTPRQSIDLPSSDSENQIHILRSQSEGYEKSMETGFAKNYFTTMESTQLVETEYSEFDPELAESFKNLREIEKNYTDKLDLLMRMNCPIDVTTHKQAYQYNSYSSDKPFTRKTMNNLAPPELEDDLPGSVTETIIQSIPAFLLNTPSLSGEDIEKHLQECIDSAKERAQAFKDSVEILDQLRSFPQACRLYLLGVQSALISTPNAANYRSRLSQLSPFTNSLDEIQMADFMANINGVGLEYTKLINDSIIDFCRHLMHMCEYCVNHMIWRLGTTILWILSSDFNNTLIYNPFYLRIPQFLQRMLKQLSSQIGQDVVITSGPFWDKNCKRIPHNEMIYRGKDGNPYVDEKGNHLPSSILAFSAQLSHKCDHHDGHDGHDSHNGHDNLNNSDPTIYSSSDLRSNMNVSANTQGNSSTSTSPNLNKHHNSGSPRPIISVSSALHTIRNSVRSHNRTEHEYSIAQTSSIRSSTAEKLTYDPSYGCFTTAAFALANSLRVSYGLLIIRQFYNHQLKLKQSRPQHMNTSNWSLDDVFMVFGYESEPFYQCTRGMFNEFMEYFTFLFNSFEKRCHAWNSSGLNTRGSKGSRHGCFRYTDELKGCCYCNCETTCRERSDILISAGESTLSYYLSLIVWVLNTYIGGMIDWPVYGDMIWRFTYASPRLRKLAFICFQSIVPYTDYLPSMLNEKSLYSLLFSKKEVEKLPSEISTALKDSRGTSLVKEEEDDDDDDDDDDEDDEDDEEEGDENNEELRESKPKEKTNVNDSTLDMNMIESLFNRQIDPLQMSAEEKEQAFVIYLLHLCVHDDFCFGAMTEERLACAQCCPFFPYLYQRLTTEIVEEEDDSGNAVFKRRFMFCNPPSLQPKSLKTCCKMLIRPEGYGASNCNLVVAEEVVYLLRSMLQSERWKTLILDIIEVILERVSDQIEIEKKNIQTIRTQKRSENKERERIVWYSMGSAVLKVMGSISRRLYSGCRVRVRQQFMDYISDTDILLQTIHQSSGTGYVIDYNINSGEVLVLLDQIQIPKIFHIYTLDVVDKVLPPDDLSNETRDFIINHIQRVIINLEYSDDLFEMRGEDQGKNQSLITLVELQNLVLEQNAIYVFHQLMISFPESVKLLSKEFISVLFSLALKPSPAKGIFGTGYIRFCFNHLAELLVDTYPGCPHLIPPTLTFQTPASSTSYIPSLSQSLPSLPPPSASLTSSAPLAPLTSSAPLAPLAPLAPSTPSTPPQPLSPRPSLSSQPLSQSLPIDSSIYGQEKDAVDRDIEMYQFYDLSRLRKAQKLQEILGKSVHVIYRFLLYFHDDETRVVNYLLEHDINMDDDPASISNHIHDEVVIDSVAVITDFDCPRSSPLFSGQSVRNIVSKKTQPMQSVPFFAQFEAATPQNIPHCLNTIASKKTSQMDIIYPIDPTGVVVGIHDYDVILSLLDTNSGICHEERYPYHEIVFHKRRFGNYFHSMDSLRRMTARICLNLDIRLLRELMITLLHAFNKQNVNIFTAYDVKPSELITFTKLIHVFYSTVASKSFINGINHMTPASALISILKETLINMVKKDSTGLLLNEFMKNCWTSSPFNSIIQPLQNKVYYVSSPNPYYGSCKYHDKVFIPKAQALRVVFDDRCCLLENIAYLTFYRDSSYNHVIARFTGSYQNFSTLHVQGDTLYYSFESNQPVNVCWGYAFTVEPLIGISWNNDLQVYNRGCFDWINWELELILDLGEEFSLSSYSTYFNKVVQTIISYISTYGAPYKSRGVELLLRLLSQPDLYPVTQLPDISGIKQALYKRVNTSSSSSKVSPEIRLILEMCISFDLFNELIQLQIPDSSSNPLPPFNPNAETLVLNDKNMALRDVHRLSRNLYYGSLPDACYLRYVIERCEMEWCEESYHQLADTMNRFNRQQDISLTSVFHQQCLSMKVKPEHFNINTFYLTQEDLIRNKSLQVFSCTELRQRLFLIRLLNARLSQVIHFIDLMDMSHENRLGTILCGMSEYIDPSTKESVLEFSIKDSAYDPKDSRPVVILDSMRTYEDDSDSTQYAPILFAQSVVKTAFSSQCTFAQMFREVMKIDVNILRSPLDKRDRLFAVKYKGEQGVDFGGLYRDAIERCVDDLFSNRLDLFLPCPNSKAEEGNNEEKYLPNPKYRHSLEVMNMYIFVGYLIGIALRTKQQLKFELPSMIWCYFIGSQPTIEDLEAVDTDFVTLLKGIREFDEEEEEDSFYDTFGLTFSITDLAGNENELIPGGSEIVVTYETAEKWCELALDFKLNEFKQAAEAITCGIQTLVPQRSIALFTWDQLERAVCGEPEIDIEDLKLHTIYVNWNEQHPVVQRFWKVMEGLDHKDRSQFLRFTWGRSKLPEKDNWPRPFRLCARKYGDDMLPLAHTCFFELELPLYSSDIIMRERLLLAIHYGANEFMLR